MKPIIKYRGGKSKEIPHILPHIPRFSGRYVEPFFGGGALFFHLEPHNAIINDINPKLIGFYRGVRNDYTNLRKELDELEEKYTTNRKIFETLKALNPQERVEDKNEALYYLLRDMFNEVTDKEYSDASLYYYINKTAYSGMIRYNSKGEFNVPFGRYKHLNTATVDLAHSLLLQDAELYNVDYSEIFNMCQEDDFVFLDPPYDCDFSAY
ncbi:MAG: Dam family site-specific DNA-(adenine-N6)-methyltransferase [Muribaculaceae bacterium]|nr:Dam family site-specific DNA-(adenine-N6)-methyltransferase [Muribaculaceae bacterium]